MGGIDHHEAALAITDQASWASKSGKDGASLNSAWPESATAAGSVIEALRFARRLPLLGGWWAASAARDC